MVRERCDWVTVLECGLEPLATLAVDLGRLKSTHHKPSRVLLPRPSHRCNTVIQIVLPWAYSVSF